MRRLLLAFGLFAAGPALAEPPPAPVIVITATGEAQSPPDRATVTFTIRGEGATSDEAVKRLSDAETTIKAGSASLLGADGSWRAANLLVSEVRSKACDGNMYGRPRLSLGDCAIIGYAATMPATLETSRVKDAATLAGLVARLGGVDARVANFTLHDTTALRGRAIAAAMTNARDEARQIAEGFGGRLGPLLRVEDAQTLRPVMMMSERALAPAPPPPPPPISVEVSPTPIETTVRLVVTFGLAS
jgi:uncharacterized protein YggE